MFSFFLCLLSVDCIATHCCGSHPSGLIDRHTVWDLITNRFKESAYMRDKVLTTSCLIRIKANPPTGGVDTHPPFKWESAALHPSGSRQKGVAGKGDEDVIALKVSHHFSLAAQKSECGTSQNPSTAHSWHSGLAQTSPNQHYAFTTLQFPVDCSLRSCFSFLFHKKRNIARP